MLTPEGKKVATRGRGLTKSRSKASSVLGPFISNVYAFYVCSMHVNLL